MDEQRESDSDFQARQDKADKKVADQEDVIRKMNGSAKDHPKEQQLLNETRHNKASLDFNRALRDYDDENEGDTPDERKPKSGPRQVA